MKRFIVLALLALGVIASSAEARDIPGLKQVTKQLTWRTSAANTAGYVDSLTASINGAVATVDTTAAFSTNDMSFASGAPSTLWGCARIVLTSSAGTAVDTLFHAAEFSVDGVNWTTNTTFSNILGTSGDEVLGGFVPCDSDLATPNIWNWPLVRFRVRADGNTGALFPDAKIYLVYQSVSGD